MSRRRRQPDLSLSAQLAQVQEREQEATEAVHRAFQEKFHLSMERQRLERAVQNETAMLRTIADLEEKAAAADDEAQAAEQNAEHLLREADRVKLDPVRAAALTASLASAYERTEALGLALEDAVVTGKPEAASQKLSLAQEDAAQKARELEAEQSVLAELAASADRLRDDAAAQTAVAATARDRAARHRAEAAEVPEVARRMAVAAWKEEQRIAKLPPARKPEHAPVNALISDGRLLHDLSSGLVYDLQGRPVVSPLVAK